MTTIYVTARALTMGIERVKAHNDALPNGSIRVGEGAYMRWISRGGWHRSRNKAVACAEEMRKNRIASLRKYIARLEAMTFEEKDGAE